MKYSRSDFLSALNQTIDIDEQISVEENPLLHNTEVKSVPSCHITGSLHYDGKSRVTSDLHLEGVMIVPDSITDQDLELDFETDSETTYSFEPVPADLDEDIVVVKKDIIDINPEIFQAIVYEAPMSITQLARKDYPKGNGWQLISDQDEKPESDEIDPRWAKLKDFQVEDD